MCSPAGMSQSLVQLRHRPVVVAWVAARCQAHLVATYTVHHLQQPRCVDLYATRHVKTYVTTVPASPQTRCACKALAAGDGTQLLPSGFDSCNIELITRKKGANKGKQVSKSDLPSKICVVCGLPFTW
jgi:hypothetical protein